MSGYTVWATDNEGMPLHSVKAIEFAAQAVGDLEVNERIIENSLRFFDTVSGDLMRIECRTTHGGSIGLAQLGNMKRLTGFGWNKTND